MNTEFKLMTNMFQMLNLAPGTMDTEESELVSVSLNERLNMNIENNTQDIIKDALESVLKENDNG